MGTFERNRYLKKLGNLFSSADDAAFLQMLWAIDALQSDRADVAATCLDFPPEAATSDFANEFAIRKWELETLAQQLLITPKRKANSGKKRSLNCKSFQAACSAVNSLRKLEDAEASIYLKHLDVLREMHRNGQRQFLWQRGYAYSGQLYRYIYIYGQGECSEYFKSKNGLSISKFAMLGFILYAGFMKHSHIIWTPNGVRGLTPSICNAGLKLLCKSIEDERSEAIRLISKQKKGFGGKIPVAYQPSILQKYPIILFGNNNERLYSPLPQLIMRRITAGLFYDFVSAGTMVLNDANKRFEDYSIKYIAAMMSRFAVEGSHKYKFRGNKIDTPDVLIKDKGKIVCVIECKATKLTWEAQFAENPFADAEDKYKQIAKGVFQLWRYFSHVRQGFVQKNDVCPDVNGVVLTLDPWLEMSRELKKEVLDAAIVQADQYGSITTADRRDIVFCSIYELEVTLARSDEDMFLRTLTAAKDDRFSGWMLSAIRREQEGKAVTKKQYPFKLEELLPWVKELKA